jgi:hypothetical protein
VVIDWFVSDRQRAGNQWCRYKTVSLAEEHTCRAMSSSSAVPDRLAVRLQENVLPLAGMSQFPTVASSTAGSAAAVAGLPVGETPFAMQSLRSRRSIRVDVRIGG